MSPKKPSMMMSEGVDMTGSQGTNGLDETSINSVCLVFQNDVEINSESCLAVVSTQSLKSGWRKNAPTFLKEMSEYLVVKVGL